jgi:hypothetical protein
MNSKSNFHAKMLEQSGKIPQLGHGSECVNMTQTSTLHICLLKLFLTDENLTTQVQTFFCYLY